MWFDCRTPAALLLCLSVAVLGLGVSSTVTANHTESPVSKAIYPEQSQSPLAEGWRVSRQNQIKVHNAHRVNRPSLKLSLTGVTVSDIQSINGTSWTIKLSDHSEVNFTVLDTSQVNDTTEFYLKWKGGQQNVDREVCVHYGFNNAKWFATYQANEFEWPLNTSKSVPKQEFNYILVDKRLNGHEYFNILEHLFYNTDGFAVLLDADCPWFIRRASTSLSDPNEAVMCFSVNNTTPYGLFHDSAYTDIGVRLFAATNIRSVVDHVVHRSGHIPRPTAIPDEWMFRHPSWFATRHMEQKSLVQVARDIKDHGFGGTELVVFGNWETVRGDLAFTPVRFPNVSVMTATVIDQLGFRLTLSVSPNLNIGGARRTRKYLLHPLDDDDEEEEEFPNLVDFGQNEAGEWFGHNLRRLYYELGVHSFLLVAPPKFPYRFHSTDPQLPREPNRYITKWLESTANANASVADHRLHFSSTLAFKSQHLPVFYQLFNMPQKHQLRSLVANVLSVSTGGYSFLTPSVLHVNEPDERLYIRWLQAIALMPRMQFHTPPWNYSIKVAEMTAKFTALHRQYETVLIDLAKRRVAEGQPIIRPMWYAAPDDPQSHVIGDQFMVGDDIVVAPVVESAEAVQRSVYLPHDDWIDQHGKVWTGPGVFAVSAPLEELPYFKRAIY